jgi:ABC-2 type transport system permease protein
MSLLGWSLRRERVQIPVWAVVGGLLALVTANAVPQAFGTGAGRATLVRLITATPSLLAIRGVPDGTGDGALAYVEIFTYLAIVAGIMSVLLVTRQTRTDEERGVAELLLAAPVGRRAPLLATLVTAALADAGLGLLVALGFVAGGLPLGGSLLAGAATGAVGLAFVGLAAVAAQLAPTSRATNGIGVALVAVAFLLRAAGDANGTRSSDGLTVASAWPSWISPIGWGQHVFPYSRPDAWPVLWCVALGILSGGAALVLRARRDLGSSAFHERLGRSRGRIRSAWGLAWRLHRTTLIAWAVGAAVLGSFAGGLGTTAVDAVTGDASITSLLHTLVPGGRGALLDEFVAAVVGIAGILAAAAGIAAVLRIAEEDRDGRTELLLATPLGRVRQVTAWVGMGVASVIVVALAAGVVAGASFAASGEHRFWSSVAAGVAQVPAALVLVAVAAVAVVLVPRFAGWVSWVALGLAFVLGQFGGLFGVPRWLRDVSPFTHTPGIPAAHVDWAGTLWLLAVAVVLGASALTIARRRAAVA